MVGEITIKIERDAHDDDEYIVQEGKYNIARFHDDNNLLLFLKAKIKSLR